MDEIDEVLETIRWQKRIEKKRWKKGQKYHIWSTSDCAFCRIFLLDNCKGCPFERAVEGNCLEFISELGYLPNIIPIEHSLSFLYQMEMYFKEK